MRRNLNKERRAGASRTSPCALLNLCKQVVAASNRPCLCNRNQPHNQVACDEQNRRQWPPLALSRSAARGLRIIEDQRLAAKPPRFESVERWRVAAPRASSATMLRNAIDCPAPTCAPIGYQIS